MKKDRFNLRDEVTELIKDEVMKTSIYKLNDRSRRWWKVSGKVIKLIAKRLNMEIDNGY
jgi:hypothetical protein